MNGEQNMGHRFELSKRHERKIKFELNSRVCGFRFLTRCVGFRLCLSRATDIIRRRRKQINDEPSARRTILARPLASPRINLNFLVMVCLPFRIR